MFIVYLHSYYIHLLTTSQSSVLYYHIVQLAYYLTMYSWTQPCIQSRPCHLLMLGSRLFVCVLQPNPRFFNFPQLPGKGSLYTACRTGTVTPCFTIHSLHWFCSAKGSVAAFIYSLAVLTLIDLQRSVQRGDIWCKKHYLFGIKYVCVLMLDMARWTVSLIIMNGCFRVAPT